MNGVAVSEARSYNTIEELTEAAELIIVAEAGEVVGRDTIGELDFVTTRMSIQTILKGDPGEGSITLRQADVGDAMSDLAPAARSGTTYLLFVVAFEFVPGTPTGDYTLLGSSGQFVQNGDLFEGPLGGHGHTNLVTVAVDENTRSVTVVP